jgi:hypothetical protein
MLIHIKELTFFSKKFEKNSIITLLTERGKISDENRGPLLTSTLATRGEICPLGGMFTTLFTPRGDHSLLFRRMEVANRE